MYTQVNSIVDTVDKTVKNSDKLIEPLRKTGFKRFPTLFMLLTTFGATATFFGMEQVIADIAWLDSHPTAILVLGISILIFTGRLFKKLG